MNWSCEMPDADAFIRCMPKAELHMHLEGSIEAELLLQLAARNGLRPRWETPEALRGAYRFRNLQAFLDLYYEGCRVLMQERDFYDITRAYLRRAHADAVVRAELFLGPQSFTERGMAIDAVMDGVLTAMRDATREDGISAGLLVSAQRHRSEAEALQLLDQPCHGQSRSPASAWAARKSAIHHRASSATSVPAASAASASPCMLAKKGLLRMCARPLTCCR